MILNRLPIRSLPFHKEDDLDTGKEIEIDIMNDRAQGLGKRARGCLIENVAGAAFTGTLVARIFNGDDWSAEIPLAQGAHINIKYEDYVFVELVRIRARDGPIYYKVTAVPGIPEDWELVEMGVIPEEEGGES